MNIIETNWQWAHGLGRRWETTELIIHHAATPCATAQQVHEMHQAPPRNWAGIAYNYYVCKDGSIYRGRPEYAAGGHTRGHNSISIGICFEGNFETDVMGEAQFESGAELIEDIRSRYPNIKIIRHKDVEATACPGRNFPFKEMIEDMTGEQIYQKLMEYLTQLPESGWSKEEGAWEKATRLGRVDGENPRGFLTREQMAALLDRLNLLK